MTVKDKLREYAEDNYIAITHLARKLCIAPGNLTPCRVHWIMSLDALFRCYEYVGNTEEFKQEIAIKIRSQLKLTKHLDVKSISDDDCLKMFKILKKIL